MLSCERFFCLKKEHQHWGVYQALSLIYFLNTSYKNFLRRGQCHVHCCIFKQTKFFAQGLTLKLYIRPTGQLEHLLLVSYVTLCQHRGSTNYFDLSCLWCMKAPSVIRGSSRFEKQHKKGTGEGNLSF